MNMSQELLASAVTGLLVSVVIIKLASGPALFNLNEEETELENSQPVKGPIVVPETTVESTKETMYSKDNNIVSQPESDNSERVVNDATDPSRDRNECNANDDSDSNIPLINEDHALKKLSSIQGLLGLSDEQMQQAIRDTNNQITNKDTASIDAADNIRRSVDSFVLLAALIFGFYVLNVYSHGEFGRMIAGLLPTEVAALKLKDYFMNFR